MDMFACVYLGGYLCERDRLKMSWMNVACLMQNEYSSEIMWPFFFASSISENCWYERLEGLAENYVLKYTCLQ